MAHIYNLQMYVHPLKVYLNDAECDQILSEQKKGTTKGGLWPNSEYQLLSDVQIVSLIKV